MIKELRLIGNTLIESYGDIYDLHRAYNSDKISVKYNFTCIIDSLNKDNQVSDEVVQNIILTYDKSCKEFFLECLDNTYSVNYDIEV